LISTGLSKWHKKNSSYLYWLWPSKSKLCCLNKMTSPYIHCDIMSMVLDAKHSPALYLEPQFAYP
jgi:hypothetical protein